MADEQPNKKFDPRDHLRSIPGKGGRSEYLEVKFRLVWLRAEHPDAHIVSDKIEGGIESNFAVFKASVTIPNGGSATGWGSETKADFGDFLEKAETKAIGRALAALGYGTQFAPELDEGDRIVDSPRESQSPAPRPPVRREPAAPSPPEAAPDADLPLPPAPSRGPAYAATEYRAFIDAAWHRRSTHDYATAFAYVRAAREYLSPDQYTDVKEELPRLKTGIREGVPA